MIDFLQFEKQSKPRGGGAGPV